MNSTQKQHDSDGKFAKGNKGGPGNPFGGRVTKMRKMLLETLTDDDMQKLVEKLAEIALEGNLSAIKLILAYTIGKPGAEVNYGPMVFDEPVEKPSEEATDSEGLPVVGDLTAGLDLSSLPDGSFGSKRQHLSSPPPLANGVFSRSAEVAVVNGEGDEEASVKPPRKKKPPKKRR